MTLGAEVSKRVEGDMTRRVLTYDDGYPGDPWDRDERWGRS